ncbi:MAG TPA: hypothetical protein VI072_06855 [Polyangiaceae bacterium]
MTGKVSQEAGPSSGAISLAGAVLCFGAAILTLPSQREPASILEAVRQHVPAARAVFDVRGKGFVHKGKDGAVSDSAGLRAQRPTEIIRATAPTRASGAFLVSAARSHAPVKVRAVGTRPAEMHLESGAAVYPDAYPGTDLIAIRDPERFAINYVIRDLEHIPRLRLKLDGDQVKLRPEVGTGAVLVAAADDRVKLKVLPPTAIDAEGRIRRGRYEVEGSALRIALNMDGMAAPVVVDPVILIPFWALTSDSRQPGAQVGNAELGTVENHVVFDTARNRPISIRPKRSTQAEDTVGRFGIPTFTLPTVSDRLRSGAPTFSPFETSEWARSYDAQSETWEWTGQRWQPVDAVGLPGLIDPAFAYDTSRARAVVYGGVRPVHTCSHPTAVSQGIGQSRCRLGGEFTATYEYDGQNWVERRIAGAPSPRLRASFGRFATGLLLFGGRAVMQSDNQPWSRWYDAPFPESFTDGLLNDTWLYDGTRWTPVSASNPPPPLESSQLVYDEQRQRAVLIGGRGKDGARFGIWEFDGKDWVTRIDQSTPGLPLSFQQRRGVAAFWHPARKRVILFGGIVKVFETCPLTGSALTTAIANSQTNATLREQLAEQGCLGGYAHDSWEWNGSQLSQLTSVAFGGFDGDQPVFRQLAGSPSWSSPPTVSPNTPAAPTFKLLPWRYDQRRSHFRLRSALERTHLPAGSDDDQENITVTIAAPSPPPPAFVSPAFGGQAAPAVYFDSAASEATLFQSGDGRIFTTDGAAWVERTPQSSPFSSGQNDFFAVAWDAAADGAVLFDPITGITWRYSDASGWARVTTPSSPGSWSVSSSVRRERDLADQPERLSLGLGLGLGSEAPSLFEQAALKQPRMTFDRQRAKTVMLYKDALWELAGSAWQQLALPSALTNCAAATLVAYDGARQRTVVAGCTIPAQTWEWNGTTWAGPFGSPFQGTLIRDDSGQLFENPWQAPLQFAWIHPNAIFESSAFGGVGIMDADGTLRVWNGSAWLAGPKLQGSPVSEHTPAYICDSSAALLRSGTSAGLPLNWQMVLTWDFVPTCFFPPVVEDLTANRVVAFRDGAAGARQIRLGVPAAERRWEALFLGRREVDPRDPHFLLPQAHPHPMEMWSPEHVYLVTRSSAAARTELNGQPLTTTSARSEDVTNNLYWPFRLLVDPVRQRVRMLTHRGAVSELGGEAVSTLGDACQSINDCAEGAACVDGVCCNDATCGRLCTTCNGTQPGICEPIPLGQPDPHGRCGSGECAPVCPGTPVSAPISCIHEADRECGPQPSCSNGSLVPRGRCSATASQCLPPVASACSGNLECADATSCKTACQSRTDCQTGTHTCDPTDPSRCVPDRASVLAGELGITPADFQPPRLRTPEEVAQLLTSAGLHRDANGKVHIPNTSFGGLQLAYDPSKQDAISGLGLCLGRVMACSGAGESVDACVAGTPRCIGNTPWLGDMAGRDCCPEACLAAYLEKRRTEKMSKAIDEFFSSDCYPGLSALSGDLGQP